ncbi:MAG: hypothetical protein LUD12_13955 [Lachnospiraceae bacterium]|nr:hypothetical protein [Lachnospiraceae bacterium]
MENKVRIKCDGIEFEASGDHILTETDAFIDLLREKLPGGSQECTGERRKNGRSGGITNHSGPGSRNC